MALDPITAALDIGGKLIDKLWPDPAQRDAAKLRLLELQQSGELAQLTADTQLASGQIEVNKVEAASNRLFVAGWRPAVGWICALALGFKYIGGPLLVMIAAYFKVQMELPDIDAGELLPILLGMLGLGAMRTAEKIKKVA